jgi:hypothetical protein
MAWHPYWTRRRRFVQWLRCTFLGQHLPGARITSDPINNQGVVTATWCPSCLRFYNPVWRQS